jgi:hypothetical protein
VRSSKVPRSDWASSLLARPWLRHSVRDVDHPLTRRLHRRQSARGHREVRVLAELGGP